MKKLKKNLRKNIKIALLALGFLLAIGVFGFWWRVLWQKQPIVIMLETMQDYRAVHTLRDYLKDYHVVWHPMPDFMFDFDGIYPENKLLLAPKENPMFLAQSYAPDYYSALCHVDLRVDFPWRELDRCAKQGAKGVIVYNFYLKGYEARLENPAIFKQKMLEYGFFLVLPFQGGEPEKVQKTLSEYAELKLYCPYWCGQPHRLDLLDQWLDLYPNLFIGTGFGSIDRSEKGFIWMQKQALSLEPLLEKHASRFLIETDFGLNFEEPYLWYAQAVKELRAFWQGKTFISKALLPNQKMQGLELSRKTQKKILFQNASRLLQWR